MYTNPFNTTALSEMSIDTDLFNTKEHIPLGREYKPKPDAAITRRRIEDILEEQALRKQWEL
ncbi:hypothetical protein [Vibrio maritimus]|uniref:hypothetical protein n=1 Tax=Vibrio maritimus TaxID=990268 RepID=UPI001F18DDCF|nr:hypothetical protein [Vibrio maritimus]